jgi:hypothetical protein
MKVKNNKFYNIIWNYNKQCWIYLWRLCIINIKLRHSVPLSIWPLCIYSQWGTLILYKKNTKLQLRNPCVLALEKHYKSFSSNLIKTYKFNCPSLYTSKTPQKERETPQNKWLKITLVHTLSKSISQAALAIQFLSWGPLIT